MAAEIVKTCKEHMPAARFIGLRYTNADRDPYGGFGKYWGEWHSTNKFALFANLNLVFESQMAHHGLMICGEDFEHTFEYWIGMYCEPGSVVPDGLEYVDLPESDVAMCWIYGSQQNGEIFGESADRLCHTAWKEQGMTDFRDNIRGEGEKRWCFFERYVNTRFDVFDDKGNCILDYGMYLNS